jgi:hypothetical protein
MLCANKNKELSNNPKVAVCKRVPAPTLMYSAKSSVRQKNMKIKLIQLVSVFSECLRNTERECARETIIDRMIGGPDNLYI